MMLSSKVLSCKHERLSDLLILTSYNMSAAQYEYKMKEDKRHEHSVMILPGPVRRQWVL